MPPPLRSRGQPQRATETGFGQQRAIALGIGLSLGAPPLEMRKLDVQHGGLQRVQAAVHADVLVVVARLHSMSAQQAELFGQLLVLGGQHATVADPSQIFGRIEAETADVAQRSGPMAFEFGTDRLRGIFDQQQMMAPGDRCDRGHVGTLTEQVDRNDGLGARGDACFRIGRDRC